jgi:hypothetical protein
MTERSMETDNGNHFHIRRSILRRLYDMFRKVPYAGVELSQLGEDCRVDAAALNWNIVYLEKSGLLELSRSTDCSPHVACSATITARGIDLIEDGDAFRSRFPVRDDVGSDS